jgi:hypothetical protein
MTVALIALLLAPFLAGIPAVLLFELFARRKSGNLRLPRSIPAAVRHFARTLGYLLAFIGWVLFSLGVFCLADAGPSHWIEEPFRWGSYWIVPGWLLLRFAGGLFPFGRHCFQWQKQQAQ